MARCVRAEQALVAERSLRDRILAFAQGEEGVHRHRRPPKRKPGQAAGDAQLPALTLSAWAGAKPNWALWRFSKVPRNTSIICAGSGKGWANSTAFDGKSLSRGAALIWVADFAAALDICYALLKFGAD